MTPALRPDMAPAPSRLRGGWQRLGKPACLSIWAPIWFAPIGAIGPLLLDRMQYGGPLWWWVLVALAGEGALLACFPIARWIVHGRGRAASGTRSRPLATLVCFYAATTARALVLAAMVHQRTNAPLGSEVPYRLLAAVLVQTGLLVMLAFLVEASATHRGLVTSLEQQRSRLAELDRTMHARLATLRAELVEQVRRTLNPQLDRLEATLEAVALGADTSAQIADLVRFVEHELRPLSHELSSQSDFTLEPSPQPITVDARARVHLPRQLPIATSMMPFLSAWLIFLGAIVGAYRNVPPGGRLAFIVTLPVAMACILVVIRSLLRRWIPPTPIAALVVIGCNAAVAGLVVWGMSVTPLSPEPRLIPTAVALGGAIGAAGFVYRWVRAGQHGAEEDLRRSVTALESRLNVLRQNAWVMRRRLGYVMHGSVQGALYAAAMRLGSGQPVDHDAIDSIRREVASAVARLEDLGPHGATIEQVLADVETVWSGNCAVTSIVDDPASGSLAINAATSECAAEIVREAVSNAAHHGRARTVEVVLQQDGPHLLITVRDDGSRWDPAAPAGLGSAMLDEMCLSWSRERTSAGTTVTAILAIP